MNAVISVVILINGNPIMARSARNVGESDDGRHVYDVDDGRTVVHRRTDGAVPLAIEMLKGIKEPKS